MAVVLFAEPVIEMNRAALDYFGCANQLAIVPGATHLLAEPGALESAAHLARDSFTRYLPPTGR